MAKPRVHEIASDLGIDTKLALAKLKEMGEFVKGPSSSVEPPVVRKLKAKLAADGIPTGGAIRRAGSRPSAGRPGTRPDRARGSSGDPWRAPAAAGGSARPGSGGPSVDARSAGRSAAPGAARARRRASRG